MNKNRLPVAAWLPFLFLIASCTLFTAGTPSGTGPAVAPPDSPPPAAPPAVGGLPANATSALGINLSSFNYYQQEYPFVNLATCGEWRNPDYSEIAAKDLTSSGYLKAGSEGVFILIHGTQVYPWGASGCTLVFTYAGSATVSLSGAPVKSQSPGRLVIAIPPGFSDVLLFSFSGHAAQLGDFRITEDFNESNPALYRTAFLDSWKQFKTIRFMDLMHTNGSTVAAAGDYPADGYLLDSSMVNLGSMTSLCNALQANAWICLPHRSADALVTRIAAYFRDHLDPGLKIYVEYSNECWNWMFDQTAYCRDQGVAQGLDADQWVAWQKFYAKRSGEIHALFDAVFGSGSARLVRVVAWQAFDAWTCGTVLDFYRDYRGKKADALAVAPYFGGSLGVYDPDDPNYRFADQVAGWSLDKLFTHLDAGGASQLGGGVDEGNLKQIKAVITADAATAKQRGIPLIAYEAGQHLVGVGAWQEDATLTGLFVAANRDQRMKAVYRQYLDIWKAAGGQELMLYASSGEAGKYGSWAIREKYTDGRAQAPKYDETLAWMAANPRWF